MQSIDRVMQSPMSKEFLAFMHQAFVQFQQKQMNSQSSQQSESPGDTIEEPPTYSVILEDNFEFDIRANVLNGLLVPEEKNKKKHILNESKKLE